jgi:hypothetical protein
MTDKEIEDLLKPIIIDIGNYDLNTIQTITLDASSMASTWSNDTITIDTNDIFYKEWTKDWELEQEWKEINKVAEKSEALQKAIERVKILYYLSKEDGNSETGHQT